MTKFNRPGVVYSDYSNMDIPSHVNYGRFVLDRLMKFKARIALIDGETDVKITYGEFVQHAVNIAESLKQFGVKIGDVIGICSENRTEFLSTAIAGCAIGAVVTFINSAYSKDEMVHTTNISKPKYMFLSPKTFNSYYESMKTMDFVKKFVVFGNEISRDGVITFEQFVTSKVDVNSFIAERINDNCSSVVFRFYNGELLSVNFTVKAPHCIHFRDVVLIGSEQTALILYSSGTTGLPKGAKLSHRNLIISGLQPLSFQRDPVCLFIVPWSNTLGIILTMDELVYNQTVVYLNRFNEETYLKCIEKYKVGLLLAVPPLVVLLNQAKALKKYDVTSVEIIYCGGAPLDEAVMNEAKKTFPGLKNFLQGYGMTETSGAVTEEHDNAPRQGSVGRIVQGNIIKIVDVKSRKVLGPNQPGEVCVKGPVLFQGYIGKDIKDDLDEEGYYKTGDIAYYDEDGYFYVVDRFKELIKYKAGQVAPSELEGLLRQHPAVKDVGVIGAPDPLVGELPTAFVVKAPEVAVTEKELVDFVADKVSSWKQVRGGVIFIKEIPKTASGKILRRELRNLLNKPLRSEL